MEDEGRLPPATPRFDTIDVLRGLAILAVVFLHIYLRFYFAGYAFGRRVPRFVAHLLFFNGGNGVTVFFAVSGFLITLTSLRRFGSLGELVPATFYRIRFARIAPLLVLLVAILSLLALFRVEGFAFSARMAPLWRAVIAAFTFHINWLEARYGFLPANWDVLWSLSIEEMFYLFFPLVCLVCFRFRRGTAFFVTVLCAFVIMGPFARGVWSANEIWQEKSYLGGMDGIALGCMAALLTYRRMPSQRTRQRSHKWLLLQTVGAAVILIAALGPAWYWKLFPWKVDLYNSLLALAACAVMVGSVLRQPDVTHPILSRLTGPIRWYGRHSYELYLSHEFVVIWAVLLFAHRHPLAAQGATAMDQPSIYLVGCWFAAIVLLTVPIAWLLARFFSEPMNRKLRGAMPPATRDH